MKELNSITELRDLVFFDLKENIYFRLHIKNNEDIYIHFFDFEVPDRIDLKLKDNGLARHLIKYFGEKIDYFENESLYDLRDSELKLDLEKAINQYLMWMLL